MLCVVVDVLCLTRSEDIKLGAEPAPLAVEEELVETVEGFDIKDTLEVLEEVLLAEDVLLVVAVGGIVDEGDFEDETGLLEAVFDREDGGWEGFGGDPEVCLVDVKLGVLVEEASLEEVVDVEACLEVGGPVEVHDKVPKEEHLVVQVCIACVSVTVHVTVLVFHHQ